MHFVIYQAIISLFSFSTTAQLVSGIILIVLCFSFVAAVTMSFKFNNLFTRIYYRISAVWLGIAFYLFLVSCFYILAVSILPITYYIFIKDLGILFIILAIIASFYGIFHARKILIKNITVILPNLPTEWFTKRAVFISDVHLGAVNGENFAKKIADKINKINPDIIFIGGDLYDTVKVDEFEIIKPFANLHPVLGVYFVTGNHEEYRKDKIFLDAIKKTGIHILYNEMVMIDGLQLIGVDDRDSTNADKFKTILEKFNIDKNKPSILLKHQPAQLADAWRAGISLQISGHTHKAQVFPLNVFTKLIFKGYDYGLKMWDKMIVYTSSGVGTWGPPLRVGSDSEIVIFHFAKNLPN